MYLSEAKVQTWSREQIMSEQPIRYQFDSQKWLEERGYLNRQLLFMDLNFWIRLVQESAPLQLELKERLTALVSSKRVLCPTSPSMIMEVGKQARTGRRDSITNLMDELSCGLSLKLPPRVFPVEYQYESEDNHAPRELVYSHFVDGMAETPFSSEGDERLPENLAKLAVELVLDALTKYTVTEFMAHWFNRAEESSSRGDSSSLKMNEAFAAKAAEWEGMRSSNKLTMEQIELGEFNDLLREILPGILNQVPLAKADPHIVDVLRECPTSWCIYKAMSILRTRGKFSGNDIWDVLHVGTAIPYVDCLACYRGMKDVYVERLRADEKFGMRIVSDEAAMLEWLSDID